MECVTWSEYLLSSFLSNLNFLRIYNYSQSFQEQVVVFSSVIILSENKHAEYSCTRVYFNVFLSIIYLIWCMVRKTRYFVLHEEHKTSSFTKKPNFSSHVGKMSGKNPLLYPVVLFLWLSCPFLFYPTCQHLFFKLWIPRCTNLLFCIVIYKVFSSRLTVSLLELSIGIYTVIVLNPD